MSSSIQKFYSALKEYTEQQCGRKQPSKLCIDTLRTLTEICVHSEYEHIKIYIDWEIESLISEDAILNVFSDRKFKDFIFHKLKYLSHDDLQLYIKISGDIFISGLYLTNNRGDNMSTLSYLMMVLESPYVENIDVLKSQFWSTMSNFTGDSTSLRSDFMSNNIGILLIVEFLCVNKLDLINTLDKIPLCKLVQIHSCNVYPTTNSNSTEIKNKYDNVDKSKKNVNTITYRSDMLNLDINKLTVKESQSERKKRMKQDKLLSK